MICSLLKLPTSSEPPTSTVPFNFMQSPVEISGTFNRLNQGSHFLLGISHHFLVDCCYGVNPKHLSKFQCVYIHVCIYILYIYIYIYIHTYIYIYIYIVCVCVCICVNMYMCQYVYVSICVCIYIYIIIHMYMHTKHWSWSSHINQS